MPQVRIAGKKIREHSGLERREGIGEMNHNAPDGNVLVRTDVVLIPGLNATVPGDPTYR